MVPPASESTPDPGQDRPAQTVGCEACQAALDQAGAQGLSYLLFEDVVTPVVGCETHLEQFTTICGLTTTETVTYLPHRPAGGLRCPSCRLASYEPGYPMIRVGEGAVAILACSSHQSEVAERFRMGLQTRQQLTADLDSRHVD